MSRKGRNVNIGIGDLVYPDNAHLKKAMGVCLVLYMCKTQKTWHRKVELMSLSTGRIVIIPYLHLRDSIEIISKAERKLNKNRI